MSKFKIAHITDMHVGKADERPYDVDVRECLTKTLTSIRKEGVDLLIVGGDICFRDPDLSIYSWLKEQFDTIDTEYLICPGNHDSIKMLSQVFGCGQDLKDNELYYTRQLGNFQLLFLDTSRSILSKNQITWLDKKLNNFNKNEQLIFMHHPPCLAGVKFMDTKYPFSNIDEIQNLVFNLDKNINIFCGHYHVDKTLNINNMTVHITPSTFFEINQTESEFRIQSHKIGWRKIKLENRTMTTRTVYVT